MLSTEVIFHRTTSANSLVPLASPLIPENNHYSESRSRVLWRNRETANSIFQLLKWAREIRNPNQFTQFSSQFTNNITTERRQRNENVQLIRDEVMNE